MVKRKVLIPGGRRLQILRILAADQRVWRHKEIMKAIGLEGKSNQLISSPLESLIDDGYVKKSKDGYYLNKSVNVPMMLDIIKMNLDINRFVDHSGFSMMNKPNDKYTVHLLGINQQDIPSMDEGQFGQELNDGFNQIGEFSLRIMKMKKEILVKSLSNLYDSILRISGVVDERYSQDIQEQLPLIKNLLCNSIIVKIKGKGMTGHVLDLAESAKSTLNILSNEDNTFENLLKKSLPEMLSSPGIQDKQPLLMKLLSFLPRLNLISKSDEPDNIPPELEKELITIVRELKDSLDGDIKKTIDNWLELYEKDRFGKDLDNWKRNQSARNRDVRDSLLLNLKDYFELEGNKRNVEIVIGNLFEKMNIPQPMKEEIMEKMKKTKDIISNFTVYPSVILCCRLTSQAVFGDLNSN